MAGFQLSANIELLFTEAGDYPARIRAAAAAGFDAVEMWGTLDKDVAAIRATVDETGVSVTSVLAQPFSDFIHPAVDLTAFYAGLEQGIADAVTLGSPRIVVSSGVGFPGMKRAPSLEKLAGILSNCVDRFGDAGVTMVLEPVNSRVDHPGVLIDRTADGAAVARLVDSPSVKLLYDLYHSMIEGEDPATELAAIADVLDYVQIADVPGRHEPGTGAIDWPASLALLADVGYVGTIGLELFPSTETVAALAYIRELAAGAGRPTA